MSITIIILLVTISISFYAIKENRIIHRFIFSPYIIKREKEFFRFISSGFIHADYQHLFFNMLALYFFGEALESAYLFYFGINGKYYFIALYIGALIFSSLPSFYKYKDDSSFYSLGASGAIDAVVFSYIIFSPTSTICLFGLVCLPSFAYGILYIIYTLHMGRNNSGNVNYVAHLYGSLFGVIYTILINPKVIIFLYYKFLNLFNG